MCRLSTVVPKAVHKAGFHPTAIFGVMGAAAGVGAALGLNAKQIVDALGIAAVLPAASSNISPKAPGPSATASRLGRAIGHRAPRCWRAPGSPVRARCSKACTACSTASRTPPRATTPRSTAIWRALGDRDAGLQALPVRDHGASLHRLRQAVCRSRHQAGRRQGTGLRSRGRHRASPVGAARRQAAPAQRLCREIRDALHPRHRIRARRRRARRLHRAAVRDPDVLALAARSVRHRSDNPYPNNFTGHIRAVLNDGRVVEERQAALPRRRPRSR